ncbi:MAG: hypothetical protein ACJA0I_001789 [Gammaproteobacteria bacterium]|jgi:hypothetical protein
MPRSIFKTKVVNAYNKVINYAPAEPDTRASHWLLQRYNFKGLKA